MYLFAQCHSEEDYGPSYVLRVEVDEQLKELIAEATKVAGSSKMLKDGVHIHFNARGMIEADLFSGHIEEDHFFEESKEIDEVLQEERLDSLWLCVDESSWFWFEVCAKHDRIVHTMGAPTKEIEEALSTKTE